MNFITLNQYRSSNLKPQEAKERVHFLAYIDGVDLKIDYIKCGDANKSEPDIIIKNSQGIRGFEITELWLKDQASFVNTGKNYPINGLTTFDLLKPLDERLEDKFKYYRKDGNLKYSISPTTLIVVDKTTIPFYIMSNDFLKFNLKAMEKQTIIPIDFRLNRAFFKGTPVNSVTVIQQLLNKTTLGSRVDDVKWFVPSNNIRASIAYEK